MASPYGGFADLSRYIAAANQPNVNPLDSLIQGVQQGSALAKLPETIQQNALNDKISQALQVAKLQQLQQGQVENVGGRLIRYNPQTRQVEVLLDAVQAPETQQFVGIVNGKPLMVGSKSGQFSFGNLPQGADISGGIAPKITQPETFSTVLADQGIQRVGNRSTVGVPMTTSSGDVATKTPIASQNTRQITNAEGLLFNQPITGGDLTPVINPNTGEQVNMGIANRVFTSDQGPVSIPSKSVGTPVATPISTTPETGSIRLTKTSSNPLSERLAKDVQSNKSYQAFRTVNDAVDGLQQTYNYALTNPSDQTGIKSSAVDAFNKIVNPNSVVRQQAFSQTTSGQSLINKIDNFVEGLGSGQTITPEQIKTMLDIAQKYKQGSQASVQKELSVIKNRGDKAGVDPNDYIPDLFNAMPSSGSSDLNSFKKKHGL